MPVPILPGPDGMLAHLPAGGGVIVVEVVRIDAVLPFPTIALYFLSRGCVCARLRGLVTHILLILLMILLFFLFLILILILFLFLGIFAILGHTFAILGYGLAIRLMAVAIRALLMRLRRNSCAQHNSCA